ncbi:MAG: threonine synthase [Leptospiraceae bacterium]|nr:threonine synthase [Leptospiraceae bacterium]MCK6381526.1 threonine synthase [Leptospiraceae bacterium]NUM40665.1 threonine synthase [Leptospiraceae bacterium]
MNNSISQFTAKFSCINENCNETYPLNEIVYNCKKCGDLLEVTHDLNSLKKISSENWKSIFNERYRSTKEPFTSGVWGKKEWVLPEIPNEHIITSGEGNSHLFHSERFANDLGLEGLYIKQCGVSHTGSFKDLGMTVLVSQVNSMKKSGSQVRAVACASTGDTSAALASYAAKAGIPAIVFLPSNKVSPAQLIQPVSNGAKVISLETDFDGCMEIVKQVSEESGIYLANSMNSLRVEGQKSISPEIVQQLDWNVPDWVIIPGGNLGNVSALGKGFEMLSNLGIIKKLPRIAVAQSQNANPLYKSYLNHFQEFQPVIAKKTLASAIQIGNPVSVKKAIRILQKFDGVVEEASESELSDAAAKGDLYGLYNDPHTGVALAALFKLLNKKVIQKGQRVVVISTANGLKFTEFKVNFHEGKIENINKKLMNSIIPCKANIQEVKERLKQILQ